MFKLDNDFLNSLGLGALPVEEKNKLLQAIYERLEMNVGMRLAEKMTDAQLDEFEGFIDRNDEAGALRWLETNFPNYKQVVAEELEKLKNEISQAAPQILSAAQSASVTGPVPPSYDSQSQLSQQTQISGNDNSQPSPQPAYNPGMQQPQQQYTQSAHPAYQPISQQPPDTLNTNVPPYQQQAAYTDNSVQQPAVQSQPSQPQVPSSQDQNFSGAPQNQPIQPEDSQANQNNWPQPPAGPGV